MEPDSEDSVLRVSVLEKDILNKPDSEDSAPRVSVLKKDILNKT